MQTCPMCSSHNVGPTGGIWNSRCLGCGWVWDDPALLPALDVPDAFGEVIGYRAWNIVETFDGPRLASQGYGGHNAHDLWNPGQVLSAKCGQGHGHVAPDEGCKCGFYAARDREHLVSLGTYHKYTATKRVVTGTVMMDGKVMTATLGYRGQNIWPTSILVPPQWWELGRDLKDAYGPWGVTVDIGNTQAPKPFAERVSVSATPVYCRCGRIKQNGKCPRHN